MTTTEKKLRAIHIWALGVGIVLVGEFMGWNFTIKLGGSFATIIGMMVVFVMYLMVVLMTNEMASVMPESGGQYSMSKYIMGPLSAFNAGLMMVLEYTRLEAADALVVGEILQTIAPGVQVLPFLLLTILGLAYINYHGAYASLTLNFFITAAAFCAVIALLVFGNLGNMQASVTQLKELTNGIPYGLLGLFAGLQFSCWFFLGIEGTAMASNDCENKKRDLPLGSLLGLFTLLVGGVSTWFICSSAIPAAILSDSVYPLYDAALATGKLLLIVALFVGTMLACLASANGCILDAARAWSVLSRDNLLPDTFGKSHPKFNSPYRAILFLAPVAVIFAMTGMLDYIVTFSIFSALMVYMLTAIKFLRFRRIYPLKNLKRDFTVKMHPVPAIIAIVIASCTLFGMSLNYSTSMIAAAAFYLISSVWFLKRRERFVDDKTFYISSIDSMGFPATIGLPEPAGATEMAIAPEIVPTATHDEAFELRQEAGDIRLRLEALMMENETLRMRVEALEAENIKLRERALPKARNGDAE